MPTALADAHIEGQARLRDLTAQAITLTWAGLPGYDRANLDEWLSKAVPIVLAGQRASVALTDAFIALAGHRAPLGINPGPIIDRIRGATTPETVYERPFITLWSKLSDGTQYESAVKDGLERAQSAAATDVQMAMRNTLQAVGEADPTILGYRRVPDPGACAFCRLVAGQRYTTRDLMPIHNHCGCGVDVVTQANRHEFTGNPLNDLTIHGDDVSTRIVEHGELGPVLVNAAHHFTSESDI